MQPRVPTRGSKATKPLTEKICGAAAETPSLTGQFHWKNPQGPRTYTKPPTQESAPEGPNLPVGSRGSD